MRTHILVMKGVTMTAPTRTYRTCAIRSHVVYEKNVEFEQTTVESDDKLEIDLSWKEAFPCMTATEDRLGMVCSLCGKHC